jgi:predicted signal transduction protein with EAL and GGDEF domain
MVSLCEGSSGGADILKDASIALKRSKSTQRGSYTVFTRQMGTEIRERATLMQHLHKAFDAERLFLMYQPQIDLSSGQFTGLEALIRWRSDNGAMIPPVEFIPLAEYSGLIVSLGAWVMRTACFFMASLKKQQCAPKRMVSMFPQCSSGRMIS